MFNFNRFNRNTYLKNNDEKELNWSQIECEVAKELFIKNCDILHCGDECAKDCILAANTFVNELKKYYGQ